MMCVLKQGCCSWKWKVFPTVRKFWNQTQCVLCFKFALLCCLTQQARCHILMNHSSHLALMSLIWGSLIWDHQVQQPPVLAHCSSNKAWNVGLGGVWWRLRCLFLPTKRARRKWMISGCASHVLWFCFENTHVAIYFRECAHMIFSTVSSTYASLLRKVQPICDLRYQPQWMLWESMPLLTLPVIWDCMHVQIREADFS